ncbi:MAG: hypothetical protein LKJ06_08795 [Schleiferilactobacillus harbinensis]|jgi:hypothetical protein|nr:hypothetical protein [Schleiferilactobacillus harbinensis]
MRKLWQFLHRIRFALVLIIGGTTIALSRIYSTDLSALGVAVSTIAILAVIYYTDMHERRR